MAEIPVHPDGTVKVRGIPFSVQCIRAAMAETGGVVVSDPDLIAELDRVMKERGGDKTPDMLVVEAIPATWFVPKRITLHKFFGDPGKETEVFLYFAVQRQFHA